MYRQVRFLFSITVPYLVFPVSVVLVNTAHCRLRLFLCRLGWLVSLFPPANFCIVFFSAVLQVTHFFRFVKCGCPVICSAKTAWFGYGVFCLFHLSSFCIEFSCLFLMFAIQTLPCVWLLYFCPKLVVRGTASRPEFCPLGLCRLYKALLLAVSCF